MELDSLHACGDEKSSIHVSQLIDLPLDHAADRLGHLPFDLRQRSNQTPFIALDNRLHVPEVSDQVDHEQGVALGLRVHEPRKFGWERVARQLLFQVVRNVVDPEEPEGDLRARALGL